MGYGGFHESKVMDDYHQLIADRVVEHSERLGRSIDYVEVGVLTGNSALAVLSTGRCRHAMLIDNFSTALSREWNSSPELVEQNLSRYLGFFEIKVGDSAAVLPTIQDKYDIGFVDGEHNEPACLSDMEKMFPLLRENGIMFVDDLENPEQLHYVALNFASSKRRRMIYHRVHHGLGEITNG
jgi:predicted O-methyltransferase YrrM